MIRLGAACIVIMLALCGYVSAIHWGDDHHPLAIDAAAIVTTPQPGQTPIAIPDPNARYAPCLITPLNLFPLEDRDA